MATASDSTFLAGLVALSENFGKIAALFSGVVLSLSVFYDYNFIRALGLSFADVPTSIADHVRSAILWLPPGLLATIASLLTFLLLQVLAPQSLLALDTVAPESEARAAALPIDAALESTPARLARYARIAGLGVLGFLVYSIVVIGPWNIGYVFVMVAWAPFALWLLRRLRRKFAPTQNPGLGSALFVLLPIIIAAVGRAGYNDGTALRSPGEYDTGREIVVKTDEGTQTCTVFGVRRFTTVAIVVGRDRRATVIPAEQILAVRQVYRVESDDEARCPKRR